MALDLSSYRKAVEALEELVALTTDEASMADLNEVGRRGLRAGVIQNFEFTYELAWKFVRRWIAINRTPDDGEARNLSSRTYDEKTADKVYAVAVRFVADARDLLTRLETAND